jgi:hypothetical protein
MIFGYRIRSRFIGAISFRIRVRLFLELELGPFSLRLNEIFILEKFFFFFDLGLDFELDDDLFRGVVLRIY